MRYSRGWDGFWVSTLVLTIIHYLIFKKNLGQYRNVNMHSGDAAFNTIDSLSAFWPGLQVLAGDLPNAIKLHFMCKGLFCFAKFSLTTSLSDYNLWRAHSGLPEVYDTHFKQATSFQYPLRPGK